MALLYIMILVERSSERVQTISNRGYGVERGFVIPPGADQEFQECEKQRFAIGTFGEQYKTILFFHWLYGY